ncbi:hypothetical protein D3Y59_13915 [Hymenobacter oligotrophus]|uniref:AraC family transcriptional regulator n=1 Tax=Hymenobacter oligotrophus TaxID=2319843 RepID=A0A3B7R3X5_9BACT|nr:hypothetical protein [Hymenobacter oligotrophus]AYA38040.1 hypothetical protein D3Y59_13915 [Hymenobacter oligotrophus]
MSRWFFIIGGVLLSVFAAVYAYLGGFATAQVEQLTTPQPIYLAGRYYEGIPDQNFAKLFSQTNELYRAGTLKGTLGNIYYNDPEKEGQEVKAFVGVVVPDTTSQQLPVGYSFRALPAGQRVLRARVKASFMLAPGKLYPALKDAVKERKLQTQSVFVEQFPEDAPSEMLVVLK